MQILKGTAARDFFEVFSSNSRPPGPVRGYLEPFLFLAIFHGVFTVLKTTPRRPGHRGVANARCPGHQGEFENGSM